jgi:hypothetical protein
MERLELHNLIHENIPFMVHSRRSLFFHFLVLGYRHVFILMIRLEDGADKNVLRGSNVGFEWGPCRRMEGMRMGGGETDGRGFRWLCSHWRLSMRTRWRGEGTSRSGLTGYSWMRGGEGKGLRS